MLEAVESIRVVQVAVAVGNGVIGGIAEDGMDARALVGKMKEEVVDRD